MLINSTAAIRTVKKNGPKGTKSIQAYFVFETIEYLKMKSFNEPTFDIGLYALPSIVRCVLMLNVTLSPPNPTITAGDPAITVNETKD